MLRELWSALRLVSKRPAFSLAVILTLALGIGGNSAIFSVVDAVILKPLPYPAADRLVAVYEADPGGKQGEGLVAPVRLAEWKRLSQAFEGIAGCYFENLTDTTGALPERVAGMRVSPGFFDVLAMPAGLGRTLNYEEDQSGGPLSVVLSDAFWRKRFNGDPSAIGKRLILGGSGYTIVGVMPPAFHYPAVTTEVWVPAQLFPQLASNRRARFYTSIGRLKDGVTPSQGQANLSAIQARLGEQYPETDAGWSARVKPQKEEEVGGVRRWLWLLFGAVGLLLLIACVNIACLMLAETSRREREIAIRFSLGASRRDIIRQLLTEGFVFSLLGSSLGLILCVWGIGLLRHAAAELPRAGEIHADWRIVAFTLGLSLIATLLFALAPAIQATRREIAEALAHGGRTQAGGRQGPQRILVSSQMALAVILLIGAGLLIRSLTRLQQVSLGFDPQNVLTFRISAEWSESPPDVALRHVRTVEQLALMPGVNSVAFSQALPAGGEFPPSEFEIVGQARAGRDDQRFAVGREVSPGYFRTLRIPLLAGETCKMDPDTNKGISLLVNHKFADRYLSGQSPVGRQIFWGPHGFHQSLRIIGLVGDVREDGIAKAPQPAIYFCGVLAYWPDPYYLVRTEQSPARMAHAIREQLHNIDQGRAVYDVRPLDEALSSTLSQQRFSTLLMSLFAATALLLATLGLYGVMSYFVSRRTREIGLRVALGARPGQILAQVFRHAVAITAGGLAAGLTGAAALSKLISSLLYDVAPRDILTFTVVPIVLAAVAFTACLAPACRAAGVDPMQALREE